MNDNWAGSSAFIQAEDSSHQSTDGKRNNPFHSGVWARLQMQGLKARACFFGSPRLCCSTSSKPFHKEGLSPLSVFSLLPKQACPRLSQVIQPQQCQIQNPKPLSLCTQTKTLESRYWGSGSPAQNLCVSHTRPDVPRKAEV